MWNGTTASIGAMRAVASKMSATTWAMLSGTITHGVKSCAARTARLVERNRSVAVRSEIPVMIEMQIAA